MRAIAGRLAGTTTVQTQSLSRGSSRAAPGKPPVGSGSHGTVLQTPSNYPGDGPQTWFPSRYGPRVRQPDFLNLPDRPAKPRAQGVTHVIDPGLTTDQAAGL